MLLCPKFKLSLKQRVDLSEELLRDFQAMTVELPHVEAMYRKYSVRLL